MSRNCSHVIRVNADTPDFQVLFGQAKKIAGESDRFVEIHGGYMTFHFESKSASSQFQTFVSNRPARNTKKSLAVQNEASVGAQNGTRSDSSERETLLDVVATEDSQPKFDNPNLVADHPEVHHYTTEVGLAGIIASQTIWATHFSDLNDSSEVRLLQDPLRAAITARCKTLVVEYQSRGRKQFSNVQSLGGPQEVAENLGRGLVNAVYQTTFDDDNERRFGAPFIASFCSHAADQPYEREHGLLSQWRGYGRDGGYCIVFDTAKLVEFLSAEFSAFDYVHLNFSPARYGDRSEDVSLLFPELVDWLERFVSETLKGNKNPSGGGGLGDFLAGTTMFKHRGFHEEREVRIVAVPGSKELQTQMLREDSKLKLRPLKAISVSNNGSGKRYISLFQGQKVLLPIKRVIVGPSRDQQGNISKARNLLESNIPISGSETPFIS